MDAHGADNKSNPIGGIVLGADKEGSLIQFPEWTSFLGNDMVSVCARVDVSYQFVADVSVVIWQFCIRACKHHDSLDLAWEF